MDPHEAADQLSFYETDWESQKTSRVGVARRQPVSPFPMGHSRENVYNYYGVARLPARISTVCAEDSEAD